MVRFIRFLLFFIIFETTVAILTQFFGIFYFWVILGANLIAFFVLLVYFLINKIKLNFNIKNIDWVLLVVIIISVLALYQIHYNYTGKFNMVNDALFQYHDAKNMQYIYPYFSDEWYAISLVREAINDHSLPLKNPFDNSFFMNPEIFFHSFIAEIMLLFGLDPLTQYTVLSIFINTLIIILAYLFLRVSDVSKNVAAIASLSILYITSASNLPGMWNLIPVTMGVVLAIIGFSFLSLKNLKLAGVSFLFGTLFYPPFFIFYLLAILVYLFNYFKTNVGNN